MKVLAKYTVVELDAGAMAVYDELKVSAPMPTAQPIVDYFKKKSRR